MNPPVTTTNPRFAKFWTGLGGILRMIWTFFPSLVFIGLTMFCFWDLTQGKDILVAFTGKGTGWFYPARILFFVVIAFWVYLTWYSSRTIAYIKQYKQSGRVQIPANLLRNYPRMAANGCFLVLELSVWQAPILPSPLGFGEALVIALFGLSGFYFIDRLIRRRWKPQADPERAYNGIRVCFLIYILLVVAGAVIPFGREVYLVVFFVLLLLLHVLYLFYSNLHHLMLTERAPAQSDIVASTADPRGFFQHVLRYFLIPFDESAYFKWFNWISLVAIVVDIWAIISYGFAVTLGPFPVVILGFAVLLGLSNLITAFSVRYAVNFHILVFGLAFFTGKILRDPHEVRQEKPAAATNGYSRRIDLKHYLREWLTRVPDSGSPAASRYQVYLVLADGGASRSGYWTASVLGELQDSSMVDTGGRPVDSTRWFSQHLFCLAGTSGGGVGVATFYSLLADRQAGAPQPAYARSSRDFLKRDFFTYTAARLLGPDYFYYLFPFFKPLLGIGDRAAALEEGMENVVPGDSATYHPRFGEPLSRFPAVDPAGGVELPILLVNTTRMQDGNPGLVTNLQVDTTWFGRRIDVLRSLADSSDISLATGAVLGARFPYLSPAGRIGDQYFVDGGYFDNSGAGAVQELIRGIYNTALADSGADPVFKRVWRLQFKVLHILNSPIGDTTIVHPVAPLSNDLFAPVLTILGAYDMQTTVNDARLRHYLEDMKKQMHIPTDYIRVSLYENASEPPYSMNWFMSDTTINRIDRRLREYRVVHELVENLQNSLQ
ncbi:MAG TPA: hypothetical protein VL978_10470 [Puia sp.]|nr:hypothetical protein [Puia sp.]